MGSQKRRRFIVVGGVIAITIILVFAIIGGGTGAKTMTVSQAASEAKEGDKIEVTGIVVNDSFALDGDVLTFSLSDPEQTDKTLRVSYDKGVAATFGNGVTAICTGTLDSTGQLMCSELVTKCPSKYETKTEALSLSRLLEYGSAIEGKPIKVVGTISDIGDPTSAVRFILHDTDDPSVMIEVEYSGGLSEETVSAPEVIVTGSLEKYGRLFATEVALEGN